MANEQFDDMDYIQQTQDANEEFGDQEQGQNLLQVQPSNAATSGQHLHAKQTPMGLIKKPIQKQKPIASQNSNNLSAKKRPIPQQFQNRIKNAQAARATNNVQTVPQKQLSAATHSRVQQSQKKNIGHKRQWLTSYKIIELSSLQSLSPSQSSTKRYKISFKFADSQTRKTHSATIRFGKRSAKYNIDGVGSHTEALQKQASIRKVGDPFCPNYWCLWLLNNPNCTTLNTALAYFREKNQIY